MREKRWRRRSLSIAEKVFIIRSYYENRGDVEVVHQAYDREFHMETTDCFLKLVKKLVTSFEKYASVAQEFPLESNVVVRKGVSPKPLPLEIKLEPVVVLIESHYSTEIPLKQEQEIKEEVEEELNNSSFIDHVENEVADNDFEWPEENDQDQEPKKKRKRKPTEDKSDQEPKKKRQRKPIEQKSIVCPDCGIILKNAKSYATHKQQHSNRETPCKICGRPFTVSSKRRLHEQTHLAPAERALLHRICTVCGEPVKEPFKKHMQRKHPEVLGPVQQFECDQCGKEFRNQFTFRDHQRRTHNDQRVRKFPCPQCPKAYFYKTSLNLHILTHTGERQFKCEFCGHAFYDQSTLRVHLRQHTGESPYVCQFCGKTCKQGQNLKSHIRHMHKEEAARTKVKIVRQSNRTITEEPL